MNNQHLGYGLWRLGDGFWSREGYCTNPAHATRFKSVDDALDSRAGSSTAGKTKVIRLYKSEYNRSGLALGWEIVATGSVSS